MKLSPETIDGLEFEFALSKSPTLAARKKEYERRREAFRAQHKHKSSAELIAELKAHDPAYIVELLQSDSHANLLDRYVHTFTKRWPD